MNGRNSILFSVLCTFMLTSIGLLPFDYFAFAQSEECIEIRDKVRSGELSQEEAQEAMKKCTGERPEGSERPEGKERPEGSERPSNEEIEERKKQIMADLEERNKSEHNFGFRQLDESEIQENVEKYAILKTTDKSEQDFKENYISPRMQMSIGVDSDEVVCSEDMKLVIRTNSDVGICVKPSTAEKLIEKELAVVA